MDWRLILTVFTTVFIAEIGDKTQLATFLFASNTPQAKWSIFVGSALALILAAAIGAFAGAFLGKYLNPRLVARIAGVGFVLIGIWTFWRA